MGLQGPANLIGDRISGARVYEELVSVERAAVDLCWGCPVHGQGTLGRGNVEGSRKARGAQAIVNEDLGAQGTLAVVVQGRDSEAVGLAGAESVSSGRDPVLEDARQVSTIVDQGVVAIVTSIHVESVPHDGNLCWGAWYRRTRRPTHEDRVDGALTLVDCRSRGWLRGKGSDRKAGLVRELRVSDIVPGEKLEVVDLSDDQSVVRHSEGVGTGLTQVRDDLSAAGARGGPHKEHIAQQRGASVLTDFSEGEGDSSRRDADHLGGCGLGGHTSGEKRGVRGERGPAQVVENTILQPVDATLRESFDGVISLERVVDLVARAGDLHKLSSSSVVNPELVGVEGKASIRRDLRKRDRQRGPCGGDSCRPCRWRIGNLGD